jgi:hypothetical protein
LSHSANPKIVIVNAQGPSFFFFFFFFFCLWVGVNGGVQIYKAAILLLEPCLQSPGSVVMKQ